MDDKIVELSIRPKSSDEGIYLSNQQFEVLISMLREMNARIDEVDKSNSKRLSKFEEKTCGRLRKIENYFVLGRLTLAVMTAIIASAVYVFDWFSGHSSAIREMFLHWLNQKS